MRNPCTGYKTLISIFSYDEQINEINQKINELVNRKQHRNMIDNRYEQIKVLKHIKIVLLKGIN